MITEEFLSKNKFEREKTGAGSFLWNYEDKYCSIVVILTSCCGDFPSIRVENKKTKKAIEFSNTHRAPYELTTYDLIHCMSFVGITKDFDYEGC